ncbi:MAG TPA: hypothetical protein DCS93_40610 [Microscillaceae bacterium]|nr:hypothetical protein [Microscillaceae bacterium]
MNAQTYILTFEAFEANQFTQEVYAIWQAFIDQLREITQLDPSSTQKLADTQHFLTERYVFLRQSEKEKRVHFSIELIADHGFQKYKISYFNYQWSSSNTHHKQLKTILNKYWLPYAYSVQETLSLVAQNLNENTVWILDHIINNIEEVSPEILQLFETALQDGDEELQIMAALIIETNEEYWQAFQVIIRLLTQRIEDRKDPPKVIESFKQTVRVLQESKNDEYKSLDINQLFPKIAKEFIRAKLINESDQVSFNEIIQLFGAPNNVYAWYSERSLETSRKDVIRYLKVYEQWQAHIEPYYRYGHIYDSKYNRESCYHPLGCYVIISQFLWHYYKLDTAEAHLIRSAQMAEQLVRDDGKKVIPFQKLNTIEFTDHYAGQYYHNPSLYALNYFYLGELYNSQKQHKKATDAYQKFLVFEPDFIAPRLVLQDGFYDLSRQIPDSRQAKERIGR